MNKKSCTFCGVEISYKNWATYIKTQKHMRIEPNRTIQPKRRGRPKGVHLHRVDKFHKSIFQEPNTRTIVRTRESAFRYRLQTLENLNSRNFVDVRQFLNCIQRPVIGYIRGELARHNNLKVVFIVSVDYIKDEQRQQINFRTRNEIITPSTNFVEFYASIFQTILNNMENFEIRGSQWVINMILKLN